MAESKNSSKRSKLSSLLLRSSYNSPTRPTTSYISSPTLPNLTSYHHNNSSSPNSHFYQQISSAEHDFQNYLHEKRRIYLIQLVNALKLGAESYIQEEKIRMDQALLNSFLPILLPMINQQIKKEIDNIFSNYRYNHHHAQEDDEDDDHDLDNDNDDEDQNGKEGDEIPPHPSHSSDTQSNSHLHSHTHSLSHSHPPPHFEMNSLQLVFTKQIKLFFKKYQQNIQNYLINYTNSFQDHQMNQLSLLVLEREAYWKEKIQQDTQNYHNLKLFEHLLLTRNDQPHPLESDSVHWSREVEYSDEEEQGNDEEDREGTSHHSPSSRIKIRELNSTNILQKLTFTIDDTSDKPSTSRHSNSSFSPLPSPSSHPRAHRAPHAPRHSVMEYYTQAERVRQKLQERITILIHEINHSRFLKSKDSAYDQTNNEKEKRKSFKLDDERISRGGHLLNRLRGEYLEETNAYELKIKSNKVTSQRSQECREESYRILSSIRSMNLQAELFLSRQAAHNTNLKVELNALICQIRSGAGGGRGGGGRGR